MVLVVKEFTPYLFFNGNCADALNFYESCLGGTSDITKVSDSAVKDQMPKEAQDKVLYAHFKSDVVEFSASDWLHSIRTPKQGNTVCLYIGGTYEELKDIFSKLADGADKTTLDPLSNAFFGVYGALTDKYGVRWMFKGGSQD